MKNGRGGCSNTQSPTQRVNEDEKNKYVPNKGKKSPETNSNETEIHDLPDG